MQAIPVVQICGLICHVLCSIVYLQSIECFLLSDRGGILSGFEIRVVNSVFVQSDNHSKDKIVKTFKEVFH